MNLAITLKSIPELENLSSTERGQLWRNNAFKGFAHWQTWAAFASCIIWSIFIGFIFHYIEANFPVTNAYVFLIVKSFLGLGIGFYVFMLVLIKQVRPHIYQEIKDTQQTAKS